MTSKETNTTRKSSIECCMCGDPGFSDQLFQCKVCQFRSQHRYCSNIYPKLESLGTCNWCLYQKESEKSPNSSNSSSPYRNIGNDDSNKNKKSRNGLRRSTSTLQFQKKPTMKLHKSQEARSPISQPVLISTRKRIITNGALEEKLRRTKSEDIKNKSGGATKHVFRNKVRRYKLLDEVSS
ncbi:hypothetical protein TanjilG_02817 [Lupinus angustifolius]|uniref:PHD-type zinc finger plants domain-containing protein n=1 Tax=Lupinus angustifolius TaxID=3871 RepID=A0A1J7HUX1_LUPAN|nr:PREDICTED: uncharacterized protein LOC109338317 [Lupinus angustifolius]XP_019431076.1 PREDICTED: uncharacterized protein LOC109338317 [Lupinus angustifolius]OIW16611.1 hypothetical protein TanjilG_02817 [Lupinus angustifolius]